MLRALLLRLADQEHVLILNLHHIVADGWSVGVLTRELGELYAAALNGQPAQLPELPVQYSDYAYWQRQWLSAQTLEQQLGYWRDQLANLEPLELPTDHPRPAVRSGWGAARGFQLARELTTQLKELSRGWGATLHQMLLAAFFVLLRRYTGQ